MTSSSSKTITNDLSVPVYYLRVKDPTVVYFKDNNSNNLLTLGYSIYPVLPSTSYEFSRLVYTDYGVFVSDTMMKFTE